MLIFKHYTYSEDCSLDVGIEHIFNFVSANVVLQINFPKKAWLLHVR